MTTGNGPGPAADERSTGAPGQATDDGASGAVPKTGFAGLFGRPVIMEARAPFEQRALQRSTLWHGEGIPDGGNKPMLVITGFLAGERSSRSLLRVMSSAKWQVEAAAVGRNSGPAYIGVDAAEADLQRLHAESGQKVTIVGHSRGGQFARILAVRYPELVSQIIVCGTPLLLKYPWFAAVKVPAEVLDMTWRAGAFGVVHPDREDLVDRDRYADFPQHIDFVSIYSRSDGIVDWRTCIEPAATLIEVNASHRGLINGVAGIEAIGKALGRSESS